MFLKMSGKLLHKSIFAQKRLAAHFRPNGLLSYAPMDELPILLLRLASFSAELTKHPICCQARMGFSLACRRQVAGPFIAFRFFIHPCTHRIQDNVSAYFKKMAVFLDQNSFKPALEQMTGPAMPLIEKLRVDAVQLTHADGQVAVRGFDEEMIMIGHEAVSVADPVVSFNDVLEGAQKVLAVSIVFKDGFLFVTARRHMINGARIFYAEGA